MFLFFLVFVVVVFVVVVVVFYAEGGGSRLLLERILENIELLKFGNFKTTSILLDLLFSLERGEEVDFY